MSDGLSARALLSSVRRHLGVVVGLSLLFCLLGAFIGLGLPPRFQAQGVLIIRSEPQRISNVQEVLPDRSPETSTILSEADVLRSRSVIESVVRSLALWRLPEFQNSQYPGGWSWQILKTRLGNMLGVAEGPDAASRETALERGQPDAADAPMDVQIDLAVNKYANHLLVQTDGHSITIDVSYRAWTPNSPPKSSTRTSKVTNACKCKRKRRRRKRPIPGSTDRWLSYENSCKLLTLRFPNIGRITI